MTYIVKILVHPQSGSYKGDIIGMFPVRYSFPKLEDISTCWVSSVYDTRTEVRALDAADIPSNAAFSASTDSFQAFYRVRSPL